MATDLLSACKTGLNISLNTTALDGVLNQKILTVKGYLASSGVSSAAMETDMGVGVIVLGVTDLWELNGGQAKFSNLFMTLAAQLFYQSYANANAFQVIYDGNGSTSGTAPIDNTIYQQADTAIVLGNIGSLARTNFTFMGWNTVPDGSGTDYTGGGIMRIGASDVTLYAKWEAA